MSDSKAQSTGLIGWFDLTVPDADALRDFYAAVVGWKWSPVQMGGYSDYCMNLPATDETVAGICHRRGMNANLPSQWLLYITVDDLDLSVAKVLELGGKVLEPARGYAGQGRFCVIQDPAGAVAALFQPATT
jgi:predicted enzyme related to lactoylglutathione lyase